MNQETQGFFILLAGIFLSVVCPLLWMLWQIIKGDNDAERAHQDAEKLLSNASSDYHSRMRVTAAKFQRQQQERS